VKLWVDAVRPAPDGYYWVVSVNEAIREIEWFETEENEPFELIDTDYDAGWWACDGGNYIHLLHWLAETGRNYPIRLHSDSSICAALMRAIIERNGWKEIR
jgi:hypothetical protein